MTDPLVRSHPRIIAGVCQGIAQHLNWDVRWVRGGFVAANVLCGAGILLYLWCWVLCPEAATAAQRASARQRNAAEAITPSTFLTPTSATGSNETALRSLQHWLATDSKTLVLIIALGAISIGGLCAAAALGLPVSLPLTIPIVVATIGVLSSWTMLRECSWPRAIGAFVVMCATLSLSVVILVSTTQSTPLNTLAITTMIIIGIAFLLAGTIPWIVQLVRQSAERKTARAIEATRLEVAAHLHDSVLQTLALIQQRSNPNSDVSRLAHKQEQSLRQWLFSADQPAGGTLRHQITEAQTALESQFPVRFEIVAIGSDEPGEATSVIAAATIEAMRNAAAHAGGTVSVYAEGTDQHYTVSVSDRGPGVNLSAIPADHFGIRESIIARTERAGGTATFRPGPGHVGTEVTLTMPRHITTQSGTPASATSTESPETSNS